MPRRAGIIGILLLAGLIVIVAPRPHPDASAQVPGRLYLPLAPRDPVLVPIRPDGNVAGLACVSASSASPGHDADRAADGSLDTSWEAGPGPVELITFDFTRYPNDHALACQLKPSGASQPLDSAAASVDPGQFNAVELEALDLVASVAERSRLTHEVWTSSDDGTVRLEHTFADVDPTDGATLSARLAAVRTVQQLQIRAVRPTVAVGWREVRLFQPLPPPFGTRTATPAVGASPTGTPSPLAQATIQIGSIQASSENPGNPASFADDGNSATFWRPAANQSPAFVQANFTSAQTVQGVRILTAMGDAIATRTATVGPSTPTPTPDGATYRVVLLRPSLVAAGAGTPTSTPPRSVGSAVRGALGLATPTVVPVQAGPTRSAQDVDCNFQFIAQDNAVIQLICSEISGVTGVRIYVDSPGNAALPPGIRELSIYPPAAATATPTETATPNGGGTATPTSCPDPLCTETPTATLVACAVPACTPTATATRTVCPASACTVTPTSTSTASPTEIGTPTATPTATPTRPPLDDAAAGSGATTASSFAAGHPASHAVDLVGATGAPRVQNEESFWQAGVAPAQGSESWSVSFAPVITLMAVQTRLYMPSAAPLAVYLNVTRSDATPVPQTLLFDGTATDRQVLGTDFGAGVPNVSRVQLIFTRPDVAPGLRTVGVFRPFARAATGFGFFASIVSRLGDPLAALTSALNQPR